VGLLKREKKEFVMTCIGAKNVANFTTLEPNKNVVGFFENKPARQAN